MYKNYINKLCNMLKINNPIIIYNNELGFSYSNNKIYVKRINDKKRLLFLSLHELRHYYQDYYICNFNNEISDIWKYEFDNYNMDNYLNYNIELDAYSFAYISMKYLNN